MRLGTLNRGSAPMGHADISFMWGAWRSPTAGARILLVACEAGEARVGNRSIRRGPPESFDKPTCENVLFGAEARLGLRWSIRKPLSH